MVGKIKHVRQKIHQEAVKLTAPSAPHQLPDSGLPPKPLAFGANPTRPAALEGNKITGTSENAKKSSFLTGIFAGTKISPEALVQTLKFEEPQAVPAPEPAPAPKESEPKKIKSKKEKMKERRQRWLNKISSIKQAKEQQAAEARRQATPVVGDMRPLADALPELSQLIAPIAATAKTARRKSRKNQTPVKRTEPTDFSQMKPLQKRKLLETETARFSEAIKTLSAKTNPLADIGEHLRKRMKREEEQGQS
ncbi:ribosome biogenesis protein SLX9 homolog isoform X2 [Nelusetta ayraudi]|uniref:ribosome biogenesis protein SLX9 homolog isoform X2 n=1 Tax=Nelusetta ayraudi TaxID=303726 RepID=UPI003F6ECA92